MTGGWWTTRWRRRRPGDTGDPVDTRAAPVAHGLQDQISRGVRRGGVGLYDAHELVTTGPYRVIRHPTYLSFIAIMLMVFGLSANWVLGVSGFLLVASIAAEEMRAQAAKLGDAAKGFRTRDWQARDDGALTSCARYGQSSAAARPEPPQLMHRREPLLVHAPHVLSCATPCSP